MLKKIILLQANRDSIYKIYKDFYQKDNNNEKWICTYLIDPHPINRNGGGKFCSQNLKSLVSSLWLLAFSRFSSTKTKTSTLPQTNSVFRLPSFNLSYSSCLSFIHRYHLYSECRSRFILPLFFVNPNCQDNYSGTIGYYPY